MKAKTARRALLTSALALLLCVSMLIGTTFAWFTDSVTSAGNIIKSGRLEVTMNYADGKEDPVADSTVWTNAEVGPMFKENQLWEPGYVDVKHIQIKNAGNLALKYQLVIEAQEGGEISDLIKVIDVYYADPAVQVADRDDIASMEYLGTLETVLAQMSSSASGELLEGMSDTVTLALKMQESAGNEYQEKKIGAFVVKLLATQLNYESDSFDENYDKTSEYPEVVTQFVGGGEKLTVGNVAVKLPDDMPKDNYTLSVSNKKQDISTTGEGEVSFDIDLLKNGEKVSDQGNEYSVEINIGKNLILTGVTHKGEPVTDYFYNSGSGVISFKTLSFSPFAVDYSGVYVYNTKELQDAVKKGINAVLAANITFTTEDEIMYAAAGSPLYFRDVNMTLDLNGKELKVEEGMNATNKEYGIGFLVIHYSNVTIKDSVGTGRIITENKSIPVYGFAHANVDIYGGIYKTNAPARNESAVYVNNPNVVIHVYGGTYTENDYAFNVHDDKGGNTPCIVLHEGVVYKQFLKSGTIDVIKSDLNNGRIVLEEGCELLEETVDGKKVYTVVKA